MKAMSICMPGQSMPKIKGIIQVDIIGPYQT